MSAATETDLQGLPSDNPPEHQEARGAGRQERCRICGRFISTKSGPPECDRVEMVAKS